MLPGDWLGTKLGQNLNHENERQRFKEAIVSFFIFLPINLLAVLSCFRLLRLFGYSEKLAGLSSIAWLLCTTVLFYTTFHQQNNQILLFVLVGCQTALAYVIKENRYLAILSGVALGIAFLIRITSILHAASVLVFLVGCITYKYKSKSGSQSLKSVLLWTIGFIPWVLLERILTFFRYGSWTATTISLHLQVFARGGMVESNNLVVQGENNGFSFLGLLTKVKLEALLAPLFYPEKSLFLFDPLVLPCLIVSVICWKFLSPYIKWYLIAGVLNFILHLYIYSWTSDWIQHGGWALRYHITSVHLLLVPLIPLLIRAAITGSNKTTDVRQLSLQWITRIIIILAILLQFASVSLHFGLESTQQQLGIGSRIRVVQRLDNIFSNIKGTRESNIQSFRIKQRATEIILNDRMAWNLLPFLYQSKIDASSSLNKFVPIVFLLWGSILILAVVATAWMFV